MVQALASRKIAGCFASWRRSCGVLLALLSATTMGACALDGDQPGEEEARLANVTEAITVSGSALLVVGNATLAAGDLALQQRLAGLGFAVTVKTGTAVTAADASGKLVVISESVTSADVNTKFRNSGSPVLSLEPALFDDLAMTGSASSEYGTTSNQNSILLLGTPGTLVGDVTVAVSSTAKTFAWGRPAASAKRVATLAGDRSAATIFAYDKGQAMVGLTAPARRLGWFATADAPSSFNSSAWSLFDASVSWAAAPATCSAGQVLCGASCVTTTNDRNNCGACGNACAGSQTCANSVCL